MPYKAVYTWTLAAAKWEEVYYVNAGSLYAAVTQANAPQLLYAMERIRPPIANLVSVRVSDVANLRTSLLVKVNQEGQGPTSTPDVTTTAAVVNITSSPAGWGRKVWMRGLPDSWVVRNEVSGVDMPNASLISGINVILLWMETNNFAIRALSKLNGTTIVWSNITAVTGAPNNTVTILTNSVTAPIPAVGSQITVSGFSPKQFPGLKGVFTVIGSTGGGIYINYTCPQILASAPINGGRWKQAIYTYPSISPATSGFAYFGEHRTSGSPLGTRGRKRGARGLRSV
jgi:hypothetical protein